MKEKHPIEHIPPMSVEERVGYLEQMLARLWDQVWWMNLPEEKRSEYEAQGFKDPIGKFYIDGS